MGLGAGVSGGCRMGVEVGVGVGAEAGLPCGGPPREEGTLRAAAAVPAPSSCVRERVKHLQYRPLVLVAAGPAGANVPLPAPRWQLLGSGGGGCSWRAPGPRVRRVVALGKPGVLRQARVVEKAPEGIPTVPKKGGRLGLGLPGAVGVGARRGVRAEASGWRGQGTVVLGWASGGPVAVGAAEGERLEAIAALEHLQVEGGGGGLLPPRGRPGHGGRLLPRGRWGGRGGGIVRGRPPPARLPLGALPGLQRSRFGHGRGGC